MITIEQCKCGYAKCSTYWLVGIGKFVQSSGFTKDEAQRIADALNNTPEANLSINELLLTQQLLQEAMGYPTGHGEAGCKENLLQAVVEVVEALREINFKPWKTKTISVDRVKLATELTDVLQFWANAANAMGLTADELTEALRAKWVVNHERIKNNEATLALSAVKLNKNCPHNFDANAPHNDTPKRTST